MALETLKGVEKIDGFEVGRAPDGNFWHKKPVVINDTTNSILFKIQNGPIKEVGVNGCQVDTLIEAARMIVHGLDEKYPCVENSSALHYLQSALAILKKRKTNREARGVEGFSKA